MSQTTLGFLFRVYLAISGFDVTNDPQLVKVFKTLQLTESNVLKFL